MKCPYKRPKIPRCFYKDTVHYVLGMVSPSLMMCCKAPEAQAYWKAMREYRRNVLRWKVEMRTATRDEWDLLKWNERLKRRLGDNDALQATHDTRERAYHDSEAVQSSWADYAAGDAESKARP